jgi:hypothetical protein
VTSVEDIRELIGPATPHFALQIRDRVQTMIEGLAPDDPVRVEGEKGIARLERIAHEGQASGIVQEGELPLPSLRLETSPAEP